MSLITSIITGGSNNHETTSTEANAHATDFHTEGVVGAITNTSGVAPATGAFAVNEDSPASANVVVSAGTLYTTATPTGQSSQLLRTVNSQAEDVAIASNTSGSTKYDWIYLKIDPDNAADSDASASNVATLVTSRSSSSTSDDGTPPTYGTLLAVVTVANGFSTISNASISDMRKRADRVSNAQLDTTAGELGGAWADWTPTLTGFSGTPTVTAAKYKQVGKTVTFYIRVTGTSNSTEKFFTLPVAPAAWQDALLGGNAHTEAASNYVAGTLFDVSGSRLKVYRGFNQSTATSMVTAWSASGTATFTVSMSYEAA